MPAASQRVGGRYRLERAVGEGGMGVVWLGHDEVLGRPVALKRVAPGASPDDQRRAMREARAAASLNHRHAVSVFDVVEDEGVPWLVMEYLDARTLADLVAAGPLPTEQVARIGAQVASALAAAHAAGITHRDVKPANILVRDDGDAKIGDFGIAHQVHDERLTRTGLVSGTPAYFSPELASGSADPGPASDAWALGVTLYAAVEGRLPHERQANALAMLRTISTQPAAAPVRAGLLTEPLRHLLDPDPGTRWTMAQAASALEDLARGVDASTVTAPPPTRRAATRDPARPSSPSPAPAPDPNATPAWATTAPGSAAPATPPAPGGHPRRSRLFPLALGVALALLAVIGVLVALSLQDPEGSDRDRRATDDSSAGPSPDASSPAESDPGTGETEEPAPEESATEEPSTEPSGPPPGGNPRVTTVDSYYDLVPDDLDTAWAMLAPDLQAEIGRDTYDGFWSTISDVDATDVRTTGPGTVTAVITYTRDDGSSESEERVFTLVREGGGYLIADDGG